MSDLVEFLRARLDEDEATAKACDMWPAPWSYRPNGSSQTVSSSKSGVSSVAVCDWSKPARHIVRWDPARVLAEVEAKRALIERCGPVLEVDGWEYTDAPDLAEYVMLALAQPYSDHPDFAPAWRQA